MVRVSESRSFWRLGEIMIQKDWITWTQLGKALADQKVQRQPLGEILIRHGIVTPKQVIRALALQYSVPFVELKNVSVDASALEMIPKDYAFKHKLVPLERGKNYLVVATSNPSNYWARAVLYRVTGITDIRNVLACPEDIDAALDRVYGQVRHAA